MQSKIKIRWWSICTYHKYSPWNHTSNIRSYSKLITIWRHTELSVHDICILYDFLLKFLSFLIDIIFPFLIDTNFFPGKETSARDQEETARPVFSKHCFMLEEEVNSAHAQLPWTPPSGKKWHQLLLKETAVLF